MSYAHEYKHLKETIYGDAALITMQVTKQEFYDFMSFVEKADKYAVRVGSLCNGRHLYFLNKDETIDELKKQDENLRAEIQAMRETKNKEIDRLTIELNGAIDNYHKLLFSREQPKKFKWFWQ